MARDPDGRGAFAGIGIVLAMVLCCAGPALVAGGALTAVGGFLGNPLVIALGIVTILSASGLVMRRRAGREECCEPDRQQASARKDVRL